MYTVGIKRGARKALARLSETDHRRVLAAIATLANDPQPRRAPDETSVREVYGTIFAGTVTSQRARGEPPRPLRGRSRCLKPLLPLCSLPGAFCENAKASCPSASTDTTG